MVISEKLLHFIWRYQLFDRKDLQTTAGLAVEILHPGEYNTDAGPDFEFAKIRIGDTLWSGQVEIHIQEKDWNTHQHQLDARYNTTILHIVWDNDQQGVLRQDGTTIPTLNLSNKVNSALLSRYEEMMHNLKWIACADRIGEISKLHSIAWLNRLTIERLEEKYLKAEEWINTTKQDWEKVFLVLLGRAFGMKVNADSFETLLHKVDLTLIHKSQGDSLKISALLFGMAGFLNIEGKDTYYQHLKTEYAYLQKIHQLMGMRAEDWKFLRMRPANFPTFRLAQLSGLIQKQSYWFEFILTQTDLNAVLAAIRQVEVDFYWKDHYRFATKSKERSISWSDTFLNHLAINAIIPMLFAYGKFMNESKIMERAVFWLENLPAEKNNIVKSYAQIGLKVENAAESQALLILKKKYCANKSCLDCGIGLAILKR